jgi:hypothetical protein
LLARIEEAGEHTVLINLTILCSLVDLRINAGLGQSGLIDT